jgi:hypothetical protein
LVKLSTKLVFLVLFYKDDMSFLLPKSCIIIALQISSGSLAEKAELSGRERNPEAVKYVNVSSCLMIQHE